MAKDSGQEKTEPATPRRKQEAREEGKVARSQETEDHQKNSEDSQHHTYQARDASLAEYVSPSARSAGSRSI